MLRIFTKLAVQGQIQRCLPAQAKNLLDEKPNARVSKLNTPVFPYVLPENDL